MFEHRLTDFSRKDCTSGISGISIVAGCSIYTLVISGQMGHAAPAECWAGCHWESHIRAADTLGIPLIVLTTQGELSRSLGMCIGTTPVGLEGMSRALQQLLLWCQPVGTPCLCPCCRPAPSPALAFSSSAGALEPKSSKPENYSLGRSRELSPGCCKIWRNWDVAGKGNVTSHRNAVTVWTAGKGSGANRPPKCRMEALPHDCSALLDSPGSLRLCGDALDHSQPHG